MNSRRALRSTNIYDYITVSQAAVMLGVSRQRVNQLIQAGRLKSYQVGPKAVLVERQSVEAWHRGKRGGVRRNENLRNL